MARKATLESRVLDVLWRGGSWSVRAVLVAVDGEFAYTTIATVLDRLHAKGRVVRSKDGVAWSYCARRSRAASLASEVEAMMRRAESASEPLLVAFLDGIEAIDPDALTRLEELIQCRRDST